MTDARPPVLVSIEDGLAAYDLFSYIGDHGGGERYPNGDCPDQQEAPCPQCDANRLAAVFKRALDATDDYDEGDPETWLPPGHRPTGVCSCGECNDLRAHLVIEHACIGQYLASKPRAMLDGIHEGAHSCNRDGQCVMPADHEGECDWGDDEVTAQ